MKTVQRAVIYLIICAPVIVGIILALRQPGSSSSPVGVGFKKLGLVKVEGAIMESESVVRQLRLHRDDHSIAGVILRVNSPGGAAAPAQEIYQEVLKFRTSGKPLIVSMGSVAASGGYYIACPARRIFAGPGTLTGSIGVIMTVPVFKELAEKIGIGVETFKAGDLKDAANPYREVTRRERQMIQGLLDDTHDQFIDDIAFARSMERDSLVRIADGRIFTGRQALRENLVDTLGGYEAALSYLRNITGLGPSARVVDKMETSNRVGKWFVAEMVRFFPHLYRFFAPVGMHCLTVFD